MLLLNFSHPLTPEHLSQVEALTGQPVTSVINLPAQFEPAEPFLPQMQALVGQVPLSADEWQTAPILINPPSLNVICALLLAELHGRMGYFPPVLRLGLRPGSLPPRYQVIEILDLQSVRDEARKKR
jgi:hypothetical protein